MRTESRIRTQIARAVLEMREQVYDITEDRLLEVSHKLYSRISRFTINAKNGEPKK